MIWPWQRHRRQAAEAQRRAALAEREAALAESRRQEAERQAAYSETINGRLREQIDRNGWTDLLQAAWGGR